jgi:hypothetical protein
MELEADIRLVQVAVEMIDPSGAEGRGAPLDAMDFISLGQQQFGEIGAVLSGHAGDQCDLVGHGLCATGAEAGAQAAAARSVWSCQLARWPAEIFRRSMTANPVTLGLSSPNRRAGRDKTGERVAIARPGHRMMARLWMPLAGAIVCHLATRSKNSSNREPN